MKKILSDMAVLFMVYVVGSASLAIFLIFKLTGKIKIINPENLSNLKPRTIVVVNHPDLFNCMCEIFLVPILFWPQIFSHPLKFAPYFTPDKANFTDKWYWFWLRPRAISVARGKKNGGTAEIRKMINVLKEMTGWIIHFLEGGRTRNGSSFLLSLRGKKIRTPTDSVGWLVRKTKARVLPIWLENGEALQPASKKLFSWPKFGRNQIIIKVGTIMNPQIFGKMDSSEITKTIAESLLKLADRE